jgi:REP element-mobilizing transposase RayT
LIDDHLGLARGTSELLRDRRQEHVGRDHRGGRDPAGHAWGLVRERGKSPVHGDRGLAKAVHRAAISEIWLPSSTALRSLELGVAAGRPVIEGVVVLRATILSVAGNVIVIVLATAEPASRGTRTVEAGPEQLSRPADVRGSILTGLECTDHLVGCQCQMHLLQVPWLSMSNKQSRHGAIQLTLDDARKPTGHGGWRPGAGRPRGRTTVAHDERDDFAARYPQHVTWRLADDVPSLRRDDLAHIIRDAIRIGQKNDFGVVEFNIEPNHLHLVTEASGKDAQARGMKGLGRRLTHRLNERLCRSGKLFTRHHAHTLKSPREVRNALRYVLNNAGHHAAERDVRLDPFWIDPYSSAPWFDGWSRPIYVDSAWKREVMRLPNPTAPARTWLLKIGWRQWGLIAFDETPGRHSTPDRRRKRLDPDPAPT